MSVDAIKQPSVQAAKKANVQLAKQMQKAQKQEAKAAKKEEKKSNKSAPVPAALMPSQLPPQQAASSYPWHHNILATQFYIGETGIEGTTAWDCHAVTHYGGIDSPFGRNSYLPGFTPKENPYYLALPYTDIGEGATHKKDIPWYNANQDTGGDYSFVKNTWVQVTRGDATCYAQWEDSLTPDSTDPNTGKRIGYGKPNHFDYVFGSAPATQPGIDVSPALSTCLGMYSAEDTVYAHSDGYVSWKFVSESDVPNGAWKQIITNTPVSWDNCK